MFDTTDASWLPGFSLAVAGFVVGRSQKFLPQTWTYEPTPEAAHVIECGIAEASDVDQDISEESVFDTFDSDAHRTLSIISVKVTCKCGEYKDHQFSTEADLTDIILGVTRSVA